MNTTRISKFLSYVLRHKPEEIGIKLDKNGWVDIYELIQKSNDNGTVFTLQQLIDTVNQDEKQRYSITGDKVRANQGHSIGVDLNLERVDPPRILYHGTAKRFVKMIEVEGLKPMSRDYVHLSEDKDTAKIVGARHGDLALIIIDTQNLENDFYLSKNGVWLTDYIKPEYLYIQC